MILTAHLKLSMASWYAATRDWSWALDTLLVCLIVSFLILMALAAIYSTRGRR